MIDYPDSVMVCEGGGREGKGRREGGKEGKGRREGGKEGKERREGEKEVGKESG